MALVDEYVTIQVQIEWCMEKERKHRVELMAPASHAVAISLQSGGVYRLTPIIEYRSCEVLHRNQTYGGGVRREEIPLPELVHMWSISISVQAKRTRRRWKG